MSVQKIAEDRVKWHLLVEALCATRHEEDRQQGNSYEDVGMTLTFKDAR